nr:lysophospholipase [Bacilli bacterium]
MAKEEIKYSTRFGDEIKGYAWPIKEPIGNVIIVTGMEEHASRYDDFALFLNKNGYSVYCLDHYGQGLTAGEEANLGIVPKSFFSKSVKNIDDIVTSCRVSLRPTYLFAHSMGSFMLQDYIQRFTDHVNKVIICGSNGPNAKFSYKAGKALAKMTMNKKNRDTKAKFMNNFIFGMYKKSVKNFKTEFDWLSVNEANVEKYIADPYCGYMSTKGFYYEFMKGCNRLYKKKFLKKIRKDMHILLIAGKEDPVGAKGKGVVKLGKMYQKLGISNVKINLYDNMRHEILNEDDKQKVYDD